MYVSYARDIAIQQDHTILFPNATFSTYVATKFFSNFTEKCQYYQQTKVQLIFYPFLDKNFQKNPVFPRCRVPGAKTQPSVVPLSASHLSLCFHKTMSA